MPPGNRYTWLNTTSSSAYNPQALYDLYHTSFKQNKRNEEKKRMEEIAALKKQGIERFMLYDGDVQLDFNPKSQKYRYVVTDRYTGDDKIPVRGVTGCIGDVLDKPGLRTWPMNMSHAFLFGSTWMTLDDETGAGDWFYNPKTAALQPGTEYSKEQLQQLMTDGQKQWTKRSDRGKDIGSFVHSACEMYLKSEKGMPAGYDELVADDKKAVDAAFNTFVKWWKSLPNPEIIAIEKPVYSRQLRYAGTFDLAVRIKGKNYLLDLKTTNRGKEAPLGIYPEYFLQLGAYSYAYREETGLEFDDVGIVNVGKDGRLSLATASDLRVDVGECERAFAFAIRLHDWIQQVRPLTKEQTFRSCLYFSSDKVDKEQRKN